MKKGKANKNQQTDKRHTSLEFLVILTLVSSRKTSLVIAHVEKFKSAACAERFVAASLFSSLQVIPR